MSRSVFGKLAVALVTVLLIVASALHASVWHYDSVSGQHPWSGTAGRVGATIGVSAQAYDCGPQRFYDETLEDHYYWCSPAFTYGQSLTEQASGSWSGCPNGYVDGRVLTGSGSVTLAVGDNPVEDWIHVSFCDFPPEPAAVNYTGWAVKDVAGPDTVCVGQSATLYPIMEGGTWNDTRWACSNYTDDNGDEHPCSCWDQQNEMADTPAQIGAQVCTSWNKPGNRQVQFRCGTSDVQKTVKVVPFPDCEVQECGGSGGGGGGCESGSCSAGSSGPPVPNLRQPLAVVRPGDGGSSGWGDPLDPCPGGGGGFTVYRCGDDIYYICTDGCTCGVYPGPASWPAPPGTFPMYLGNSWGLNMTTQGDSAATSSYSITDAEGNTTYYDPPFDQVENGSAALVFLPTKVVKRNGHVVEYVRDSGTQTPDEKDQGLTKVIFHDHDCTGLTLNGAEHVGKEAADVTWTYDHTPGQRRITEQIAPDGVTTVTEYDPVVGRISAVKVYEDDTRAVELSKIEYFYTDSAGNYDPESRLRRVEKNNLRVLYDYSTDGQTITITEKSKESGTVFSQTVYTYTDDTTTIRRRNTPDVDSNDYDQRTIYKYFTKVRTYGQVNVTSKTWLREVTDPEGNVTTYGVYVGADEADAHTVVTGLTQGVDYRYTSNPNMVGKVFRTTDAHGNVTTKNYDYDEQTGVGTGYLLSVTYPDTSTEQYSYYPAKSWPLITKDVRDNYTMYERDAAGHVLAVRVADSTLSDPWNVTSWSSIAPVKEFSYYPSGDQKGMLYTETIAGIDPEAGGTGDDAYTKTYSYVDAQGNPNVNSVSYPYAALPYDSSGQVTQYASTDPSITTVSDEMGRTVSSTDANGRTTYYTYDKLGRTKKTIYEGTIGSPVKYTENFYTTCCGLDYTVDEEGNKTRYAYRDDGRVSAVWTDIQGDVEFEQLAHPLVEYTYDSFGNTQKVRTWIEKIVSGQTQYISRDTDYVYDRNGRVISVDHPGTLATEEFGYDEVGNMVWKSIGGVVYLYKYDDLNRLTDVWYNYTGSLDLPITYPTTDPDESYAYEGSSRLRTSAAIRYDGVNTRTSSYTYDLMGRVQTYTPSEPSGRVVTYGYNALGQKESVTLTSGGSTVLAVDYKYYSNGWLKSVLLNGSPAALYTYDQAANRERVDLGNTTYTTYEYDTYDVRYLLSGIDHIKEGTPDTSFAQIGYARDAVGNPTTIGGQSYTYDANNRLDSWVSNADYNYDWVGNRLTPGDMEYNEADQLTDWPGQHKYTYLMTGSLHQQKNSAGTEVEKGYSYTYRNLLSTVTHYDEPNDPVNSMQWDAEDNRVSFTSSTGGTTYFVYDPTAGIPAVIEEVTPSGPVFYVREPNGSLIARVTGTTAANIRYYHFDALGSTRVLTDGNGAKTDEYTYDAWGKLTNRTTYTGTVDQPYMYVGQLGYYTHYQDANLPLLQLGVRFYDPEIGRFTQVDPARDGLNMYLYAGNQVTDAVDPLGLSFLRPSKNEICRKDAQRIYIDCLKRRIGYGLISDVTGCFVVCGGIGIISGVAGLGPGGAIVFGGCMKWCTGVATMCTTAIGFATCTKELFDYLKWCDKNFPN